MSTGAGDGTLWQIAQAIANCEAFYLQANTGVDDLAKFSPVIPNTIAGAYPATIGFYEYSTHKPYQIQGGGAIGGRSAPLRVRCHYFKRLLLVGMQNDDMENTINPQLDMWVDIYDTMLAAHQTLGEPQWAATHKILPNVIVVPTVANGHAYQNKGVAFTTGGTEPTWNTGAGSTTTDGAGTWTEIRAPWGAVTNMATVTKSEVFSLNTEEGLAHMGIAFSVEATAFPRVTVGL